MANTIKLLPGFEFVENRNSNHQCNAHVRAVGEARPLCNRRIAKLELIPDRELFQRFVCRHCLRSREMFYTVGDAQEVAPHGDTPILLGQD